MRFVGKGKQWGEHPAMNVIRRLRKKDLSFILLTLGKTREENEARHRCDLLPRISNSNAKFAL